MGLSRVEGLIEKILRVVNQKMHANLSPNQLADLAQDVLLVCWRKNRMTFRDESLAPWLYRVCDLELRNFVRRERRFSTNLGEPLCDQKEISGRENGNRVIEHEGLYLALGKLSKEERAVIDLKHFGGLKFEQIGSRLGYSPNTAKTRYYRALRRLRRILEKERESHAR